MLELGVLHEGFNPDSRISKGDQRISMVPDVAEQLIKDGYGVIVEKGAGIYSGFTDEAYQAKGCKIASRAGVIQKSTVLFSIEPPTADFAQCKGKVIISWVGRLLDKGKDICEKAKAAGVTLIDVTAVPRITIAQKLDVLSSQAKVAGHRAVIEASYSFGRFHTAEMTAAGKYPPSQTFVLGCGVAGLAAIGTSKAMGSVVRAWDVRDVSDQVHSMGAKWVSVEFKESGEGQGGYAKESSDAFKKVQQETFKKVLSECDIAISTAAIPGRPSPLLITKDAVGAMRPGSVIVDLAAAGGGNCELTKRLGEAVVCGRFAQRRLYVQRLSAVVSSVMDIVPFTTAAGNNGDGGIGGRQEQEANQYFLHLLQENTQVNLFLNDPRIQSALELRAEQRHRFALDNVYAEANAYIAHLEATADANHRQQLAFVSQSTHLLVGQLHNEVRVLETIARAERQSANELQAQLARAQRESHDERSMAMQFDAHRSELEAAARTLTAENRQHERRFADLRSSIEENHSEMIAFLGSEFEEKLQWEENEYYHRLTSEAQQYDSLVDDLQDRNAELIAEVDSLRTVLSTAENSPPQGGAVPVKVDPSESSKLQPSPPQGGAAAEIPVSLRTVLGRTQRYDIGEPDDSKAHSVADKPCYAFQRGKCPRGGGKGGKGGEKKDTSKIPCIFFPKGTCKNGKNCPFMHKDAAPSVPAKGDKAGKDGKRSPSGKRRRPSKKRPKSEDKPAACCLSLTATLTGEPSADAGKASSSPQGYKSAELCPPSIPEDTEEALQNARVGVEKDSARTAKKQFPCPNLLQRTIDGMLSGKVLSPAGAAEDPIEKMANCIPPIPGVETSQLLKAGWTVINGSPDDVWSLLEDSVNIDELDGIYGEAQADSDVEPYTMPKSKKDEQLSEDLDEMFPELFGPDRDKDPPPKDAKEATRKGESKSDSRAALLDDVPFSVKQKLKSSAAVAAQEPPYGYAWSGECLVKKNNKNRPDAIDHTAWKSMSKRQRATAIAEHEKKLHEENEALYREAIKVDWWDGETYFDLAGREQSDFELAVAAARKGKPVGHFKLLNVGTAEQVADVFTKPFTEKNKWTHALKLIGHTTSANVAGCKPESKVEVDNKVSVAAAPDASKVVEDFAKQSFEANDYSFKTFEKLAGLIRTNLKASLAKPRSFMASEKISKYLVFGAWVHGGCFGITNRTKHYPWICRYVNEFVKRSSPKGFTWTSFVFNFNGKARIHTDKYNQKESYNLTFSFGNYTGGMAAIVVSDEFWRVNTSEADRAGVTKAMKTILQSAALNNDIISLGADHESQLLESAYSCVSTQCAAGLSLTHADATCVALRQMADLSDEGLAKLKPTARLSPKAKRAIIVVSDSSTALCKKNRRGVFVKADLDAEVNIASMTLGWAQTRYTMCWGKTLAWIVWQVEEHVKELRTNYPDHTIDVICWWCGNEISGQWGCIPTRLGPGLAYRDPNVTTETVARKVRRAADVLAALAGEPDIGFVKVIGQVEADLFQLHSAYNDFNAAMFEEFRQHGLQVQTTSSLVEKLEMYDSFHAREDRRNRELFQTYLHATFNASRSEWLAQKMTPCVRALLVRYEHFETGSGANNPVLEDVFQQWRAEKDQLMNPKQAKPMQVTQEDKMWEAPDAADATDVTKISKKLPMDKAIRKDVPRIGATTDVSAVAECINDIVTQDADGKVSYNTPGTVELVDEGEQVDPIPSSIGRVIEPAAPKKTKKSDRDEDAMRRLMFIDESAPQGAAAMPELPNEYFYNGKKHLMKPFNPEDIVGDRHVTFKHGDLKFLTKLLRGHEMDDFPAWRLGVQKICASRTNFFVHEMVCDTFLYMATSGPHMGPRGPAWPPTGARPHSLQTQHDSINIRSHPHDVTQTQAKVQ
ncbi:pntA [Symbiodinium sp. CCMP2592]|nr:pntA [Symbiodinium sp. CCMP2592]